MMSDVKTWTEPEDGKLWSMEDLQGLPEHLNGWYIAEFGTEILLEGTRIKVVACSKRGARVEVHGRFIDEVRRRVAALSTVMDTFDDDTSLYWGPKDRGWLGRVQR